MLKDSINEAFSTQIQTWFPFFEKNTIKTEFVQIPQEYIEFLLRDGVFEIPELDSKEDESEEDTHKFQVFVTYPRFF